MYSLGAVLYELLVSTLPLDLRQLAYDEVLRRLRDQDAPRPSTRLRTLGESSAITARNRSADPPTLARQLRGDPDAIVLKALEKDRKRRYASPSDLAADLGRYLRNEPVVAHAPSTGYRAQKYIRRAARSAKPWKVALATLVVALPVAGSLYYQSHQNKPLTAKDTIVIADFDNHSGDQVFDGTLRQGLSIQLEQSPFLSIISDQQIQQTLQMMTQKPDAELTPAIASQVCVRTGSAGVLDGSIAQIGTQYSLILKAVNCVNGELLASTEAEARDKNHVLDALSKAAMAIRRKLGESPSNIQRFNTPLEEATTPSLEALQAYSIGRETMVQKGEDASSVPLFERAIRLDPDFAMAYAAFGNAYSNLGEPGLANVNITKAYELREHVSQREKFYIESHYYQFVTGDPEKARHAYEVWAETYPGELAPRTNLAVIYSNLGKFQKSTERAKEALSIAPGDTQNYANLVNAYISLDQPNQAKAVAEEAFRKNLDSPFLRLYLYDLVFLQSDVAGMQQQLAWSSGVPGVEDSFLDHQASTAAYVGQLDKARGLADRASAAAVHAGEKETAASYELDAAQWEVLYGNWARATQRVDKALALAGDRDTQYGAAVTLAFAGELSRATTIADALNRRFPEDTFVQSCYLPVIRGVIALKRRDSAGAVRELAAASPYELGLAGGLLPVYIRGLAYLESGDGNRASTEFQKIIDHPGVVLNDPIGSLAWLERGRAEALSGQRAAARSAYEDFLQKWQDADTDVPILWKPRPRMKTSGNAGCNQKKLTFLSLYLRPTGCPLNRICARLGALVTLYSGPSPDGVTAQFFYYRRCAFLRYSGLGSAHWAEVANRRTALTNR